VEVATAFVLDTDVIIDVQRGHDPAVAWFASLAELPSVPGFVVMELVQDARDTIQVGGYLVEDVGGGYQVWLWGTVGLRAPHARPPMRERGLVILVSPKLQQGRL
jgi:hypothetical protein